MTKIITYTKRDGENFWKKGFGMIDACCRTRDINNRSTIALKSKSISFSAHYPVNIKMHIRKEYKDCYPEKNLYTIKHCTGIYLLLCSKIDKLPGVFICADGYDIGLMKHYLKMMLGYKYDEEKVMILPSLKPLLGKRNPADRLAAAINRDPRKASMILKEKDLCRFLKSNKKCCRK